MKFMQWLQVWFNLNLSSPDHCFNSSFSIAEKLAKYKWLDGGVYFVDQFPMTPSGKVIRSKVREMAQSCFEMKKKINTNQVKQNPLKLKKKRQINLTFFPSECVYLSSFVLFHFRFAHPIDTYHSKTGIDTNKL